MGIEKGKKYRIKTLEEILEDPRFKDPTEDLGSIVFTTNTGADFNLLYDMRKYLGRTATITEVYKFGDSHTSARIDLCEDDGEGWYWLDEMLKPTFIVSSVYKEF